MESTPNKSTVLRDLTEVGGPEMRIPELSVIVPTYNEAPNIKPLVVLLHSALDPLGWEVVFVDDDSPDGTAEVVKSLAIEDSRVRCLHRIGRRGLASACIEGILSSAAPACAVMDADLQHDERLLPSMLREISSGADLVVGSRHVDGGSAGDGLTVVRWWGSQLAIWMSKLLLRIPISDPMSGFFMLRREDFERVADRLSPDGFKILLDYLASADRPLCVKELPFTFRARLAGESKLDTSVTLDFLNLLLLRFTRGRVNLRFVLFALVGTSGVFVHLFSQKMMLLGGLNFKQSQIAATLLAMTSNFLLNNRITYRDRRLKGRDFYLGMLSFFAICGVGFVANVGIATWIHDSQEARHIHWWISSLCGVLMTTLWNYAVSATITWKK